MIIFDAVLKKWMSKDCEGGTRSQVLAITLVSLAQINLGMSYAWGSPYFAELLSPASPIRTSFEDTTYLVIAFFAARAVSSPIFSVLVDTIGRRDFVILTCVPCTAAWLLIYFAKSLSFLYLSRWLAGMGDAALFTAIPMYVGEISEAKVRGTWGSSIVVSITLGQFAINVIGYFWDMRTSALVCSLIPLFYASVCLMIPRSPYYLIMKNRDTEAVESLQRLRGKSDVQKEFLLLQEVVKKQTAEKGSYLDLFRIPSNRKASLITLANRTVQNFSGLPVFSFYTQYIFQEAGNAISQSVASIIYTAFYLTFHTLGAFLVSKTGRRPAMILSTITCSVFLTLEAIYFLLKQSDYHSDIEPFGWIPLVGLVGYIAMCSLGMALVPTVMLSELFPVSVKGNAMCLNNIVTSVNSVVVAKLFQLLMSSFGMFGPFSFFSMCTILGIVYSVFWLPETKGRSLHEMQQYFKHGRHSAQSQLYTKSIHDKNSRF